MAKRSRTAILFVGATPLVCPVRACWVDIGALESSGPVDAAAALPGDTSIDSSSAGTSGSSGASGDAGTSDSAAGSGGGTAAAGPDGSAGSGGAEPDAALPSAGDGQAGGGAGAWGIGEWGCVADTNDDHVVSTSDIGAEVFPDGVIDETDHQLVIAHLGAQCFGSYGIAKNWPCVADLNEDGQVDGMDHGLVLACQGSSEPACDVTRDGIVDIDDERVVNALFGKLAGCPSFP